MAQHLALLLTPANFMKTVLTHSLTTLQGPVSLAYMLHYPLWGSGSLEEHMPYP